MLNVNEKRHVFLVGGGPFTNQLREISLLLRSQPQPSSGLFHVNFHDVMTQVLPATNASCKKKQPDDNELTNISLGQMQQYKDKIHGIKHPKVTMITHPDVQVPATNSPACNVKKAEAVKNCGFIPNKTNHKSSSLGGSTKANTIIIKRPQTPNVSLILSKASCLHDQKKNEKQASWRQEDNLNMLTAITTDEDEAETITFDDDVNNEDPQDFFVDDQDDDMPLVDPTTDVSRQVSLRHVRPLMTSEQNPYGGKVTYFSFCYDSV